MSMKIVVRWKGPLGGRRWTFHPSYVPALGICHWLSRWIAQDFDMGYVTTYHVNGRLVARPATYRGV